MKREEQSTRSAETILYVYNANGEVESSNTTVTTSFVQCLYSMKCIV